MTTDNRIICPPLDEVLRVLDKLVEEHPTRETPFRYLEGNGSAHDLVSHILVHFNAPVEEAFAGELPPMGPGKPPTSRNATIFPNIWNRLFLGRGHDDSMTWPSGQDFVVYALLWELQKNQDHGKDRTWANAAKRAKRHVPRWLKEVEDGWHDYNPRA